MKNIEELKKELIKFEEENKKAFQEGKTLNKKYDSIDFLNVLYAGVGSKMSLNTLKSLLEKLEPRYAPDTMLTRTSIDSYDDNKRAYVTNIRNIAGKLLQQMSDKNENVYFNAIKLAEFWDEKTVFAKMYEKFYVESTQETKVKASSILEEYGYPVCPLTLSDMTNRILLDDLKKQMESTLNFENAINNKKRG